MLSFYSRNSFPAIGENEFNLLERKMKELLQEISNRAFLYHNKKYYLKAALKRFL